MGAISADMAPVCRACHLVYNPQLSRAQALSEKRVKNFLRCFGKLFFTFSNYHRRRFLTKFWEEIIYTFQALKKIYHLQ